VASIKRRDDGTWRARYRDAAGKEHAAHRPTRKEAQAWLDRETAKLVRSDWVDPRAGKVTFSDYASEWITTKASVAPRTRINVEGRLENYAKPFFGPMPIASVRPMHARAFVADLVARGLAPSTVKAVVLTAGQVFTQAVADGLIARSPLAGVDMPSQRHREEMHFLDADQVNHLAETIADRYRVPVYVAAYAGLRAGELWALTPARVNSLGRTIDVVESLTEVRGQVALGPTKTGKRRTITVPRFLAEMIGEHIARYPSNGHIFTAAEGGPVRHRNFSRRHFCPAVAQLAERGCLPVGLRWHDLRHSCAALLIANGRHIEEVKDYLGHSSIRTTSDRYAHLFPRARAELADALDTTFRTSVANLADYSRTDDEIARVANANQGRT
jgi:integrase